MSAGAWIMLFIGAAGLWGSLVFFILHYFKAAREEARAGGGRSDEGVSNGSRG